MAEPQLFPVQLADLTAWGFAVPDALNFGGAQRVGVHQLPNGVRVIDSMGPDDSDISWKGMFLKRSPGEPNPVDAARYVDFLRKQGAPVTLSWDVFEFQVIVEHFKSLYEFPTRVAFEIVCKVVEDRTQPVQSFTGPGVDALVQDDFANILSLVPLLNMAVAAGLPGPFSSSSGSATVTAMGVYFLGGTAFGGLTSLFQPDGRTPVPLFASATDATNFAASRPGQYADFTVNTLASSSGNVGDTLTLTATQPDGTAIPTFGSLALAQQFLSNQPPGFSARFVANA